MKNDLYVYRENRVCIDCLLIITVLFSFSWGFNLEVYNIITLCLASIGLTELLITLLLVVKSNEEIKRNKINSISINGFSYRSLRRLHLRNLVVDTVGYEINVNGKKYIYITDEHTFEREIRNAYAIEFYKTGHIVKRIKHN